MMGTGGITLQEMNKLGRKKTVRHVIKFLEFREIHRGVEMGSDTSVLARGLRLPMNSLHNRR